MQTPPSPLSSIIVPAVALFAVALIGCSPPSRAPGVSRDESRQPTRSIVYINEETGLPREPTDAELAAAASVITTLSSKPTPAPVETVLPDGAAEIRIPLDFSSVACVTPEGEIATGHQCAGEGVQQ